MLIPFGILSASASFGPTGIGVAGYIGGGETSGGDVATINKFDLPTDSRSTLADGLSVASAFPMGFANSGVAGYMSNRGTTTINKFGFPSDSRSTIANGLSQRRLDGAGFADTAVAGYFLGGFLDISPFTTFNIIDKIAFPSDSSSVVSPALSSARGGQGSMANYGVAGYAAGGGGVSTVVRLAFPSDTQSNLATGLSSSLSNTAGNANQSVAGYISGGGFPLTSAVDKFAFPSETRSSLGTGLSQVRRGHAGYSNSGLAGYFGGGNDDTTATKLTGVDKFDFSNDSRSTLGTGLTAATSWVSGFSNEGVF